MPLLEFSDRGIYCQQAGVFIDPWKSVPKAVITHAHSDHAVAGCQNYLSTPLTRAILKHRLGSRIHAQSLDYNRSMVINGVRFSFHPAGHIAGSAQVRVESKGEVWVVSGDYKRDTDGVSEPFELVKCNTFVTESTFGLPVYRWPEPTKVFDDINTWWSSNKSNGLVSVLAAYSLGKAQRILKNLDQSIGPVYCHPAVEGINNVLRSMEVILPESRSWNGVNLPDTAGAMIITPSLSSVSKLHAEKYNTAAASGWMTLRGRRRWYNVDTGFVISDHADWPALNRTIDETQCQRIIVTHGYKEILMRWLNEQGLEAQAENTTYEGETT